MFFACAAGAVTKVYAAVRASLVCASKYSSCVLSLCNWTYHIHRVANIYVPKVRTANADVGNIMLGAEQNVFSLNHTG